VKLEKKLRWRKKYRLYTTDCVSHYVSITYAARSANQLT